MTAPSDLADRLGLAPGARAIILNADDFGMCHAANTAIVELLTTGHIDSTTVMVPCSWSPEALAFAASRTGPRRPACTWCSPANGDATVGAR